MDLTFDVQLEIYKVLEKTISRAIDIEIEKRPEDTVMKTFMLDEILKKNMDMLENACYATEGPGEKLYLAGGWLIRPVWDGEKMIPMMNYLQSIFKTEKIVYLPEKTGMEVRKDVWNKSIEDIKRGNV